MQSLYETAVSELTEGSGSVVKIFASVQQEITADPSQIVAVMAAYVSALKAAAGAADVIPKRYKEGNGPWIETGQRRRLNSVPMTFEVEYQYLTDDPNLPLVVPVVTEDQIASASNGALSAANLDVSAPEGVFFVRIVGSADTTAVEAAVAALPYITVISSSVSNAPPSPPPSAPPPAPYAVNNKLIIGLVVGLTSFLAILVALRMRMIAPGAPKEAKADASKADASQTASNAAPAEVELVDADAPADTQESERPSLLTSLGNMIQNVSTRFSLSENDSPVAATEKV